MDKSMKLYLRSIWEIELPPYIYPIGIMTFLTYLLFGNAREYIFEFSSALLGAILITLIPGILQKRLYLRISRRLGENNLSDSELYEYKKVLLGRPIREGLFSSVRWVYGMLSCSLIGQILIPDRAIDGFFYNVFVNLLIAAIMAPLGFVMNSTNTEIFNSRLLNDKRFSNIDIAKSDIYQFSLIKKTMLLGLTLIWVCLVTFSAMGYGIFTGKITLDTAVVNYLVASVGIVFLALYVLFRVIKADKNRLSGILSVVKGISDGNLDTNVTRLSVDEVGEIAEYMNMMKKSLSKTISSIKDKASDLNIYAANLSTTSQQLESVSGVVSNTVCGNAKGAASQAEDLANIMHALSNFDDAFKSIKNSIVAVREGSELTESYSRDGRDRVDELNNSVKNVTESFEFMSNNINKLNTDISYIGKMADMIKVISGQTKLLALNAAIEAARAGESGKGFAVVADEIRQLAVESKKATENISKLVSSITTQTEDVVDASNEVNKKLTTQVHTILNTNESFDGILKSLLDTFPKLKQTFADTEKAVNEKDHVIEKIHSISTIAEQTSTSSQEVAASVEGVFTSVEVVAKTAENLKYSSEDIIADLKMFKL